MKENPEVRTRYAPSPTGVPHVGNIRTALFAESFARAENGSFVLRIEDTDQARIVPGAVDEIKDSLAWLGITWDELIVQSERLSDYQNAANELKNKGFAEDDGKALRFIVPKNPPRKVSWVDAIGSKTVSYNSRDIEDFIILKSDGFPTYHMAKVVDDHNTGISHVIRGDDWIPSTPKHILLYEALGWEAPVFAHVPNVIGPDRKKLSKRHGAKSALDFKREGYLPEALFNALMLLGWSPGGDKEVFSREEVYKTFSLGRINVAPAIFDENGKLSWLNVEYMMKLSDEELEERILDFDPGLSKYDRALVSEFLKPSRTRMKTLADFGRLVSPFLGELQESNNSELKNAVRGQLKSLREWTKDEILGALKRIMSEKNVRLPDIYEALIGQRQGLSLPDAFEILGKETTLSRLE